MQEKHEKQREISIRRDTIADRHLKGRTVAEIAGELGVCRRTVDRDLAAIRRLWRQAHRDAIEEARARELARIDLLEREAWEGWQRSQQQYLSEKLSKAEDEKESRGETAGGVSVRPSSPTARKRAERTTRTQHGDSRYLMLVMRCIERRLQLLNGAPPEDALTPASAEAIREVLDQVSSDPGYRAYCRQQAIEHFGGSTL
jgi:hypothetical protein